MINDENTQPLLYREDETGEESPSRVSSPGPRHQPFRPKPLKTWEILFLMFVLMVSGVLFGVWGFLGTAFLFVPCFWTLQIIYGGPDAPPRWEFWVLVVALLVAMALWGFEGYLYAACLFIPGFRLVVILSRRCFEDPVKSLRFLHITCFQLWTNRTQENVVQPQRVKSVAFHREHPDWILLSLYSGHVELWKGDDATKLTMEVNTTNFPVRACVFVERKDWIAAASDDCRIRIFSTTNGQQVTEVFGAHTDYIRSLSVHPTRNLLLSASDDLSVKLWDLDDDCACLQTFHGHYHYVMAVAFHPTDPNLFATASLDRTIRFWNLSDDAATPSSSLTEKGRELFLLEGHERGVNCIDFYPESNQPLLVSGSDDGTLKIWNYQTRQGLRTLRGHTDNVNAVLFHPTLPILVSLSEDGTLRFWHHNKDTSGNYQELPSLRYGTKGRGWALAGSSTSNHIAVGFDEGCLCLELEERGGDNGGGNTGRIDVVTEVDISRHAEENSLEAMV